MRIDVLTLFPRFFESPLQTSMMKRAQTKKKVNIHVHDIRQFATDKHRTCDDRPFGGGPGMVLKLEPIDRLMRSLVKGRKRKDAWVVHLTPQGKTFHQNTAKRLSKKKHLILLCGHYEGVDERIVSLWVKEELSIGDYVLTGGEIPALTVMDAVSRLMPGVLGNPDSKNFESFTHNLLEYPHYTRPEVFRGRVVPPVLLTGNHKAIQEWRHQSSVKRTRDRRPDLLR
jgi:tRNA (guanine37-N1)-methyltransferase